MSVQRDSFRFTLHNQTPLSIQLSIRPRGGVLRIREEHASLTGVPEMSCDWSGVLYEWWTVLQRGPSFSKLVWDIPPCVSQTCMLYVDESLELSMTAKGAWFQEEEGLYIWHPSSNDVCIRSSEGDVFASDGGSKATHASVNLECTTCQKKKQAMFIIEGTDRKEYITNILNS